VKPDVRMNPILLKPEADDRSQVIVMGRVSHDLSRLRWRERPASLWPVAEAALRELLAEHDLVLIEGAGSPAETNLRSTDLANMRSAHAARASVVLVADIDRGGAFAHLHGTWSLVDDIEPLAGARAGLPAGRGFVSGSVLGISVHGAVEHPDVVAALLGARPERTLEHVFDDLADLAETRLDVDMLVELAGVA
jgi:cobyric acid synthase